MRRIIARPWVILLAAGGSARFGSPKQLARIGGETLLRRAARAAVAIDPPGCVVVLGAGAAPLRRQLAGLPVRIVVNRAWRRGLSRSLAKGIGALPQGARAALVFLADQTALGPGDLALVAAAWRRKPNYIIASSAAGVLGPPAVFPRRMFPALRRLQGDAGARSILRDPARDVVGIELPASALDVDRPADLWDMSSLPSRCRPMARTRRPSRN